MTQIFFEQEFLRQESNDFGLKKNRKKSQVSPTIFYSEQYCMRHNKRSGEVGFLLNQRNVILFPPFDNLKPECLLRGHPPWRKLYCFLPQQKHHQVNPSNFGI